MTQPKAVFFDVGATLLTPAEDEGVVFSRIARQFDVSIQETEVAAAMPLMYGLYEQLYEQDDSFWSDDIRARAIWIEMYEYAASLLKIPKELHRDLAEAVYRYYFSPGAWKTFDDVIPLLDALQDRGIRMGLISNWDSTLSPIIEGLELSQYFETILSSAVVRLHKPMPEIFHLALSRLALLPSEAMHIGDHVYADAKGAADVGITPVLLDRHNRYTEFDGQRVHSLLEVLELI